MIKKGNYIKVKREVVDELLENKEKKIYAKEFRRVAKKYKVSVPVAKRAYSNFLNFGKVDVRCRKYTGKESESSKIMRTGFLLTQSKETKEKCKRITTNAMHSEYDSKKIGQIFHEYLFGTKEKYVDYLNRINLNNKSFQDWKRELKVSGTIKGRLILDYKKYGKINVTKLFKYCKYKTRGLTSGHLAEWKWSKDLTPIELDQLERASRILYLYL